MQWRNLLRQKAKRRKTARGESRRRGLHGGEALEIRNLLTATPLGAEVAASALFGSDQLVYAASDIDTATDGSTVMGFEGAGVFSNRRAGNDQEIFVQRFSNDGTAVGDLLEANELTRGDQQDPVVAIADDGGFLVVWSGRGAGDRTGIFGQRFDADGNVLGDAIRINTEVRGDQVEPTVAMAADGRAVVAWHGPGVDDASGVWMQRIATDGSLDGEETLVNSTTENVQAHPSAGMDDEGNFVIAWSSRSQDGDGWGVFAQRFSADGTPQGSEFNANTTTSGSQMRPSVSNSPLGEFVIAWNSHQQDGDGWGVFARRFDETGSEIQAEFQLNEQTAGQQRDVDVVMADAGELFVAWNQVSSDGLGWAVVAKNIDSDGNDDGGVVTVSESEARIAVVQPQPPAVSVAPTGTGFVSYARPAETNHTEVYVQSYTVSVGPAENERPVFENISDQTAMVGELVQVELSASDPNVRDQLTFRLDSSESPSGAIITPGDENGMATLEWTPGVDDRGTTVFIRIIVEDEEGLTDASRFGVTVVNAAPVLDLNGTADGVDTEVDFAMTDDSITLLDSNLTITDADQTELSGAEIRLRLAFDLSAENLSIDTTGTNITQDYNANSKVLTLTGVDSIDNYESVLRTLRYENNAAVPDPTSRSIDVTVNDGTSNSDIATIVVDIEGENETPTIQTIPTQIVSAGAPLWVPLNGFDADGDSLTFTATSDNTDILATEIPVGNRSARISVQQFGDMVFQLFEDKASRATDRMITLAEQGFYDGLTFHRVIDDFVIQGGDPNGDGTGGSDLGDFDDQYNVELQHTGSGLLSMAKTTDDTNNSQFFVTEGTTRHLDFNHTIFGVLVEGEDVREAISEVSVVGSVPVNPVVMDGIEIFSDVSNGALLLKAPEGVTGSTNVTVTVSDGLGGTTSTSFRVDVVPDTDSNANSSPFLDDIPDFSGVISETLTFQVTAQDVEGDRVRFLDQSQVVAINNELIPSEQLLLPVRQNAAIEYAIDPDSGELTFSAPTIGEFEVFVAVVAADIDNLTVNSPIDYQVIHYDVSLN